MTTKPKQGSWQHLPTLAFCGFSGSGKSTLIERLISHWRGLYQIGFLKSDVHGFEMDRPGKDTARMNAAGAARIGIADAHQWALLGAGQLTPWILLGAYQDCELVLIEGYKESPGQKIVVLDEAGKIMELYREGRLREVRAFIGPWSQWQAPQGLPYFQRDQVELVAQFIIEDIFLAQRRAQPLYGLVLTGGQSSRMGQDKALLSYRGQGQAEATFALLGEYCPRVFLSARAGQWEGTALASYPQIHDRLLGFGPVGGILSAMQCEPDARWLVVACDLPFLDENTLQDLLRPRAHLHLATAFRSANDQLPEPLCALYEPGFQRVMWNYLGAGVKCPRKMLSASRHCALTLQNQRALENVNTPQELQEARRDLGEMTL